MIFRTQDRFSIEMIPILLYWSKPFNSKLLAIVNFLLLLKKFTIARLDCIYDLQQMSASCDTKDDNSLTSAAHLTSSTVSNINNSTAETNKFSKENNSGVSDDDADKYDEVGDLDGESGDDDEEDDEPPPSPIFHSFLRGRPGKPLLPSPPKAIYGNGNDFGATLVVRISIHTVTTTQLTMAINSNNNKIHIKWDNNKYISLVIPSNF